MSTYKFGSVEVIHQPTTRPSHAEPLPPSRTLLEPGHRRAENSRAIEVATILERDQILTMRDGVRLRADIYRPATGEAVPAIVMWGPYGKSGSGWINVDHFPYRVGIAEKSLSGYENFEGLDPAEWVPKQYAIVNVDARGIGDSEGDVRWWSTAEGRDGHDAVEEISQLPWCTGKVSLAGNSWLAIAQWYIAAEHPRHLTCIAPMEGVSDPFREHMCRGGIPNTRFTGPLARSFIGLAGSQADEVRAGRGQYEDLSAMVDMYPRTNEYWEDKRARFDQIRLPSYVVASYSTGLHTLGSFRGFEEMASDEKWLSVHATQEWYDLYTPERTRDLQSFFDHYLKGVDNGWEDTPRVRYSFIQFDKESLVNVPFPDLPWNLATSSPTRLFLSPGNGLSVTKPDKASQVKYQADAFSKLLGPEACDAHFAYTFSKRTLIAGPATVTLHVASPGHNDMDVFVQLRKADKHGKLLEYSNIPLKDIGVPSVAEVANHNVLKHLGPQGMLRASRRHVSESLSSGSKSWKTLSQSHDHEETFTPGEVVRLEILLWPTGMGFDAGDQLILYVSGHYMVLPEFDIMPQYYNYNQGEHIIQVGAEYDSSVLFYAV